MEIPYGQLFSTRHQSREFRIDCIKYEIDILSTYTTRELNKAFISLG
jgi:hypothetical protein